MFRILENYRIDENKYFYPRQTRGVDLRHENRLAEFWSGCKFHKKKERYLLRSLRLFAVEFFKTTLNLPPGCKRWIISFMGRAHRPSAIRHRPASALRPIRCRYIVMDVTCRDGVTLHPVMSDEFPVFADNGGRNIGLSVTPDCLQSIQCDKESASSGEMSTE